MTISRCDPPRRALIQSAANHPLRSRWLLTQPQICFLLQRAIHHRAALSDLKSLYVDSVPPTNTQQAAARKFFLDHAPTKSWTATEWRKDAHSNTPLLIPEIAFLGRSNVGKSSLLNALFGSNECRVGSTPGKTKLMHAWSLARQPPLYKAKGKGKHEDKDYNPKLVLLDMPGYGFGSRNDWGQDIMKYLTRRRQLRRAFVLVNPKHGFKQADIKMLELLQMEGVSHQLIATKCDETTSPQAVRDALQNLSDQVKRHLGTRQVALQTLNDVLAVGGVGDGAGNTKIRRNEMRGVEDVMWAVLRASGLDDYAMRAAGSPVLHTPKSITADTLPAVRTQEDVTRVTNTREEKIINVAKPAATVISAPQSTPPPLHHGTTSPASDQQPIGLSISDFLNNNLSPSPSLATSPKSASHPTTTPSTRFPKITTGFSAFESLTQSPPPRHRSRQNSPDDRHDQTPTHTYASRQPSSAENGMTRAQRLRTRRTTRDPGAAIAAGSSTIRISTRI